jgi:hypothetical protein
VGQEEQSGRETRLQTTMLGALTAGGTALSADLSYRRDRLPSCRYRALAI